MFVVPRQILGHGRLEQHMHYVLIVVGQSRQVHSPKPPLHYEADGAGVDIDFGEGEPICTLTPRQPERQLVARRTGQPRLHASGHEVGQKNDDHHDRPCHHHRVKLLRPQAILRPFDHPHAHLDSQSGRCHWCRHWRRFVTDECLPLEDTQSAPSPFRGWRRFHIFVLAMITLAVI